MVVILRYFSEFGSIRGDCIKVVEDIPKPFEFCRDFQRRKTSLADRVVLFA